MECVHAGPQADLPGPAHASAPGLLENQVRLDVRCMSAMDRDYIAIGAIMMKHVLWMV